MAIKLYRCPLSFVKTPGHGCWQAQKALDEAGIDYELVKVPLRRPKRAEVIRLTGQEIVPVIQFEDGSVLREEGRSWPSGSARAACSKTEPKDGVRLRL